jgi:hypothetical protein
MKKFTPRQRLRADTQAHAKIGDQLTEALREVAKK